MLKDSLGKAFEAAGKFNMMNIFPKSGRRSTGQSSVQCMAIVRMKDTKVGFAVNTAHTLAEESGISSLYQRRARLAGRNDRATLQQFDKRPPMKLGRRGPLRR